MTGPLLRAFLVPAAAVFLLLPTPSRAQAIYTFSPIADTSAGSMFVDLGLAPNVNASGVVAYTGQFGANSAGVFTGFGGGSRTTVATNAAAGTPTAGFSAFDTPRINAVGAVVFRGVSADTGAGSIFGNSAAGGAVGTLVDSSGDFTDVFSPALNNAGQVAFTAVSSASGSPGVFRRDPAGAAGSVTTVGTAPANFSQLGQRAFVNPAGAVAFVASVSGAATGTNVFLGSGGGAAPASAVSVGVAALGLASIDLESAPHVSDDGQTVTFLATRNTGSRGVFQLTLGNNTLTPLVETGNGLLFSDISAFSLAGNQFAFLGVIAPTLADPDGSRGIFNGANPVLNRIVVEGDLLTNNGASAAVSSLAFADGGLNANGQVAFYAGFADNTAAIFRADVVPEPGSVALLLTAGGAVIAGFSVRRHRRRSL